VPDRLRAQHAAKPGAVDADRQRALAVCDTTSVTNGSANRSAFGDEHAAGAYRQRAAHPGPGAELLLECLAPDN
jgi:hypothetical protein